MSQPPSFANIGLASSSDQYFRGTKQNDIVILSTSNANLFLGQTDPNNYIKVDNTGISIVTRGSNVCNFGSNVIATFSNVTASNVQVNGFLNGRTTTGMVKVVVQKGSTSETQVSLGTIPSGTFFTVNFSIDGVGLIYGYLNLSNSYSSQWVEINRTGAGQMGTISLVSDTLVYVLNPSFPAEYTTSRTLNVFYMGG
jgi:hypothetical protein